MKTVSYGWIEAAVRYAGRFGPREKITYQDIFQLSAPSVSRHQEFVANALEEATDTKLFHKNANGHLKGGKLLLLKDAERQCLPECQRLKSGYKIPFRTNIFTMRVFFVVKLMLILSDQL